MSSFQPLQLEGRPLTGTDLYRNFGDERLSAEQLELILYHANYALVNPPEGVVNRDLFEFEEHVVMGDIRVDLAVADPERAEKHLDDAEDTLERAIDIQRRAPQALDRVGGSLVLAHLRIGELGRWEDAAVGEDVETNYAALLEAAQSVPVEAARTPKGSATLRSYILPLLGLRVLDMDLEVGGWSGRTALSREQRRRDISGGDNWRVGIAFDASPGSYINPPHKMQEIPVTANSHLYNADTLGSARRDPDDNFILLNSLLVERDMAPIRAGDGTVLTPLQLERITRNLGELVEHS